MQIYIFFALPSFAVLKPAQAGLVMNRPPPSPLFSFKYIQGAYNWLWLLFKLNASLYIIDLLLLHVHKM
jgi:hypothetical protein